MRFESRPLPLFKGRTEEVGRLLRELCLHGLADGDFDLALREAVGGGRPAVGGVDRAAEGQLAGAVLFVMAAPLVPALAQLLDVRLAPGCRSFSPTTTARRRQGQDLMFFRTYRALVKFRTAQLDTRIRDPARVMGRFQVALGLRRLRASNAAKRGQRLLLEAIRCGRVRSRDARRP